MMCVNDNALYSAPLVTHTVSSCKLFIDLCSRGKKSIGLERKLCFVTCTSQYIHWLGYSQCCVVFSGRDFCRVILSGNWASLFPKVHGAIIWIGRKKMLCSFDWIQYNLCPLCGHFSSQNRWFQRGHVMVTRYDWMAMCSWAEGSLVAFWTAELVNDMHGNYWFWQRTSKRPLRKKANWEEWEQMEKGRGREYYKRRMNPSDHFWIPGRERARTSIKQVTVLLTVLNPGLRQ